MTTSYDQVIQTDDYLKKLAPNVDFNQLYDGKPSNVTSINFNGEYLPGKVRVDLSGDKPKIEVFNVLDKPNTKDPLLLTGKFIYDDKTNKFQQLDKETNQVLSFSSEQLSLPKSIGDVDLKPNHYLEILNDKKLSDFSFKALGNEYTADFKFKDGVLSYDQTKQAVIDPSKSVDIQKDFAKTKEIEKAKEIRQEKEDLKELEEELEKPNDKGKSKGKVKGAVPLPFDKTKMSEKDAKLITDAVANKDYKQIRNLSQQSSNHKGYAQASILKSENYNRSEKLKGLVSAGQSPKLANEKINKQHNNKNVSLGISSSATKVFTVAKGLTNDM